MSVEVKLIFSLVQMKEFTSVLKIAWKITSLWCWILIIFISWNLAFVIIAPSWFSFDFSSCVYHLLSKCSVLICDYKLLHSSCLLPISLISSTRDLTLSSASSLFMTLFPVSQLQHNPVFISKSLVVTSQITSNSEYIKPHSLSSHQYLLGVWDRLWGEGFPLLSYVFY